MTEKKQKVIVTNPTAGNKFERTTHFFIQKSF